MKKPLLYAVLAAAAACGNKPSARVRASLTDAPLNVANVAHFNLTVSEVRVKNDDDENENEGEGQNNDRDGGDGRTGGHGGDHHDADQDGARGQGWVVLCDTPQVFDLMALRNGNFAPLCNGKVTTTAAGHLSKIWLNVTAAQLVFNDGTSKDLAVPHGKGNGLVIDVDDLLEKDKDGELKIDFLAGESVEDNGNGTYTFHPRAKELHDHR